MPILNNPNADVSSAPGALDELAKAGQRLGRKSREHKLRVEARKNQLRKRNMKLMTSPYGRIVLRISQSFYFLLFPAMLVTGGLVMFLENSQITNQFQKALRGIAWMKGIDVESVSILVFMLIPFILFALFYLLLKLLHHLTIEFYYNREKNWLETLTFQAFGYWEFLSPGQPQLKVSILYKKLLPDRERLENVVRGLGFVHSREVELIEDYFDLPKGSDEVDDPQSGKVTMDHVSSPSPKGRKSSKRYGIETRKELRLLIESCLIPIHQEFPIAGIKIDS